MSFSPICLHFMKKCVAWIGIRKPVLAAICGTARQAICKLRTVPPIVVRMMSPAAGAPGLPACRIKVFVAII
jgi:hypothetical protein